MTQGVDALANRYYDQLIGYGGEALRYNPLTDVTAPAHGEVLWSEGGATLSGYEIGEISRGRLFQEDRKGFETIGFPAGAQEEGLWFIRGVSHSYDAATRQWTMGADGSHMLAHFNPTQQQWTVVRRSQASTTRRPTEWKDQWSEPTTKILPEERAAIHRVAQETAMLVDTAFVLREDLTAYYALTRELMARARRSPQPHEARSMGAILDPYNYLPDPVSGRFAVSIYGRIMDLAIPLYRALANKEQTDASGIAAVRALITNLGGVTRDSPKVKEGTVCPPYEPIDRRLGREAIPGLVLG